MRFAIITHVAHGKSEENYFGYGPYIREMNIWLKYVSEVTVVAPLESVKKSEIDLCYQHEKLHFKAIPSFSFTSVMAVFKALLRLPEILWVIFKAMKSADHIHLRCPGNVGLLGCFVQILFPKKPKTAKYAGNWDPNAKQPWSYRLQKWILSNTFLTRNMQVLVYGEWEGSSKNIKPFFTASYTENDKTHVSIRQLPSSQGNHEIDLSKDCIRFLFVGTLSEGKRPLYAIQLVERLRNLGYSICLDFYGQGKEKATLEAYIKDKGLEEIVVLKGNQTAETVQKAYQISHFLVLPSKSEGWPKVVAEAMFWGCVPLATQISCVPYMVGHGERGIILSMDLEEDIKQLAACVSDADGYLQKGKKALDWSRHYTLDYFDEEIRKLLAVSNTEIQ